VAGTRSSEFRRSREILSKNAPHFRVVREPTFPLEATNDGQPLARPQRQQAVGLFRQRGRMNFALTARLWSDRLRCCALKPAADGWIRWLMGKLVNR
jgi:hypothetical protein